MRRLFLQYGQEVPPHTIRTYWLKVPPIHRRESVSMGYIAHAFRDVLPGEAVPPFPAERVAALKAADPALAEKRVADFWDAFFAKAAQFDLPDPVLNDIYLSRLATRAILDIPITEQVVYNACSPFFYFDHAYRDQSYVVFANDLAGLHERAARVLRAYCMDVKDVKKKGPISFDGQPLAARHAGERAVEHAAGPVRHAGPEHLGAGRALQAERRPAMAGADGVSLRPARRHVAGELAREA